VSSRATEIFRQTPILRENPQRVSGLYTALEHTGPIKKGLPVDD